MEDSILTLVTHAKKSLVLLFILSRAVWADEATPFWVIVEALDFETPSYLGPATMVNAREVPTGKRTPNFRFFLKFNWQKEDRFVPLEDFERDYYGKNLAESFSHSAVIVQSGTELNIHRNVGHFVRFVFDLRLSQGSPPERSWNRRGDFETSFPPKVQVRLYDFARLGGPRTTVVAPKKSEASEHHEPYAQRVLTVPVGKVSTLADYEKEIGAMKFLLDLGGTKIPVTLIAMTGKEGRQLGLIQSDLSPRTLLPLAPFDVVRSDEPTADPQIPSPSKRPELKLFDPDGVGVKPTNHSPAIRHWRLRSDPKPKPPPETALIVPMGALEVFPDTNPAEFYAAVVAAKKDANDTNIDALIARAAIPTVAIQRSRLYKVKGITILDGESVISAAFQGPARLLCNEFLSLVGRRKTRKRAVNDIDPTDSAFFDP